MNLSLANALTWNEPWHDKVVKESEYFVFGKIISIDENKGVSLQVIRTLSGPELSGTIQIQKFYLLSICSWTGGQRPTFELDGVDSAYFFLKKINDTFAIATPTTGFAALDEGRVTATYRHSYHQASVVPDVYENTMTAIFQHYHGQSYDTAYINAYVKKYLSQKPVGFSADELDTFFSQHVALETIYHLRLAGFYTAIVPFLQYTGNFHSQVSAARALVTYNTADCKELLIETIQNKDSRGFLKVMCIWSMREWKPVDLKQRLAEIEKKVSDDSDGFGGNIMDHRVCTSLPNAKFALGELIAEL